MRWRCRPPRRGQRIVANADHVYRAAADLVRHLRPPALDELGLATALEACVARWHDSYPELAVQLSVGGELDDLGETMNLALYRMVQEALTNCVRHAGASHFYIDLTRAPDQAANVLLEMRDDGAGFVPGTRKAGSGLTACASGWGSWVAVSSCCRKQGRVSRSVSSCRCRRSREWPMP